MNLPGLARLRSLLGRSSAPEGRQRRGHRPYADRLYAPAQEYDSWILSYALNEWVSTAVDRMASITASVPLQLVERDTARLVDLHPLLDLLGRGGRPNEFQDAHSFWVAHQQRLDIYGNDYWLLYSEFGGPPSKIYMLDPRGVRMQVLDGALHYEYSCSAGLIPLLADSVIHFKQTNLVDSVPLTGISALGKLKNLLETDSRMVRWNKEAFGTGAPDGILVLDADYVSASEAERIEDDLILKSSDPRRLKVVRARAGAAVWQEANLRPRDMDYVAGRFLTRQSVFDAFGFHVGLVSESSTEAHARVAERLVRNNAYERLQRTSGIIQGLLRYWPDWSRYELRFDDVRVVDWQQESLKLAAVQPYMTVDEVRSRYLNLPALPNEEELDND